MQQTQPLTVFQIWYEKAFVMEVIAKLKLTDKFSRYLVDCRYDSDKLRDVLKYKAEISL